eukprot:TRINITY_DN25_c1_g2_i3.p2 TRINITY_DN25_c1_g2~~TRINITY_DN25_c1_g2_i3.p2  ORF type:complete len:142 (+),score=44.81 TRINITY_DN25_c1_g2_i3:58-483(+)
MGHTSGSDDSEHNERPCCHNDWDDVRTRKGFKVLRCRICQGRWKIPSCSVPRCMPFLHDCCNKDEGCPLLHVRRRKTTIYERYEQFGNKVLKGCSREIKKEAKRYARAKPPPLMDSNESDGGDEGPPALLDEEVMIEVMLQ